MIFANKLDFYLGRSEHEALMVEAEKSLAVEKIVRASLPENLGKYCSIGRLSEGRLNIYADNGSIALKLRQLSRSLLAKLQSRGLEIDSIRISARVKPAVKPLKRPRPVMGEKGKTSFRELADSLEDSPLKSAIESLLEKLDHQQHPLDDIK